MKKPFMEMDLDDFDEVSSNGGLDFDFSDEETEVTDDESTPVETTVDTEDEETVNVDDTADETSDDTLTASMEKTEKADADDSDNNVEEIIDVEETIPEDEEITQEGMFDAGFGNLRYKIAQALKDKFKVTNVGKGMGGKEEFAITEPEASYSDPKTTIESTGSGCKVVSRGNGKIKCHFQNIPLSKAFDKIMELFKQPELLLEGAFYDISRFGDSIYQEEDESEVEETTEESIDDIEVPEELKEDESTETEEVEVKEEDNDGDTEEVEEVDIEKFGSDDSDVQNDFNQEDVDRLNKLIAAESEAINDYFDASKDTRDENLRTLYSDIGHEERFHLEQLMYSKSQLTGEKYEPRDPEVKKEYEELISGGMDEDTAASTAIDKITVLGTDDEDDTDMEEIEQEAAMITEMLYRNEILDSVVEYYVEHTDLNNRRDRALGVFLEAYVTEAMDNVGSASKQVTGIKSPFKLLGDGIKFVINMLTKLATLIRDSVRKSKIKHHRMKEWLDKHGIDDLFKEGIKLYLYDDNQNRVDFDKAIRYVDFLYRVSKAIGATCGVKLTKEAQRKPVSNPIKFNSIDDAMYQLSRDVFTKTKVVVTDSNRDTLRRQFFGYNDEKINVKVSHGDDIIVNDSDNVYNKLATLIVVTKQYLDISNAIIEELVKIEGNPNSVYYKNRQVYNAAYKNMKIVITKYKQFINVMSHDLTEILRLNNGLLEMTRTRDMTEQSGGKWEGDDVRVIKSSQPTDNKYIKKKK